MVSVDPLAGPSPVGRVLRSVVPRTLNARIGAVGPAVGGLARTLHRIVRPGGVMLATAVKAIRAPAPG